jgi:glycerol-3-phosphate dehydrogenase subunit B
VALGADVVVVGGGLAGTMAALSASNAGASVRLVSHKQSTLAQASGLVDVLGAAADELVSDPFARLDDLPAGHPYERVGVDAVRAGLAAFDAATDYCGAHTDRNALVPTHGGTVKPTARYPEGVAAGLASDDRDALLVGFERLPDFHAPFAADHLAAAGVPFAVRGVTLRFPADLRNDPAVTRYASLLDGDASVERGGVRGALAAAVEPHLDGESRVGFPAVLGEERHDEVRRDLESHLGVDVFEVPTGPPSLPGLRLEAQLYDALSAADVAVETGNPVVDYDAEGDRIERVIVERKHTRVPVDAEQVVLATGGLVGRGIDSDRESVTEPVFGLHVPHPADRYEWSDGDAFGDHAFARFGVAVDRELRPTTEDDGLAFENLRAAGAVLGGADFAAEKSGSGVSIATGHVAGAEAGDAA